MSQPIKSTGGLQDNNTEKTNLVLAAKIND
jgi:hypothetical protein